eukprot:c2041_g1_i1 orf=104-355(+)
MENEEAYCAPFFALKHFKRVVVLSKARAEEAAADDHNEESAEHKTKDGDSHVHVVAHHAVACHYSLQIQLQLHCFALASLGHH